MSNQSNHGQLNQGHSDDHVGHIIPAKIFLMVLLFLMAMTVLTVGVSLIDMGPWNIIVAMLVASVKALVVALFFMHLKYEDPFTWCYAGLPIFILSLLLAGVFIDNPFRIHATPPVITPPAVVQSK